MSSPGRIYSELLGLEQMLSAESDPDLQAWYLQEYQQTEAGQELRLALLGKLTTELASLTQHPHFAEQQPVIDQPDIPPQVEATEQTTNYDAESDIMPVKSQAIYRAVSVHDEFTALPTNQKERKLQRQDKRFVRAALKQIDDSEDHIIHRPGVVTTVLETWSALAMERGGRSQTLLETAVDEIKEYVRHNWSTLPKTVMAGLVKELSHDGLAKPGLEAIIGSYFDGPIKLADKIDALADFALSAQHLTDDQTALDLLGKIVCFDSQIIKPGSQFQQAIGASILRVDDLEVMVKHEDLVAIISGVTRLSSYGRGLYEKFTDVSDITKVDLAPFYEYAKKGGVSFDKAIGEAQIRAQLLETFRGALAIDLEEFIEIVGQNMGKDRAEWLRDIKFASSPRIREYYQTFGYRALTSYMVEDFLAQRSDEFKNARSISLPFMEDYQMVLAIPPTLVVDEALISSCVLEANQKFEAQKSEGAQHYQDFIKTHGNPELARKYIINIDLTRQGKPIAVLIRGRSELDRRKDHEINKLIASDLPDITGPEFAEASAIISRIEQLERRFVSKRGFMVRFVSDDLTSRGFEFIAFKQDTNNPAGLNVALKYGGQLIRYKLNSHRRLNVEDRAVHAPHLQEILERRTLAILEDYATREALETSEGSIAGSERGTTTRIATLAYLPEGQNFSQEAWEHYRVERGRDLLARSLQRKLVDARGRNTTYRRATEVDDPTAGPLEVYILDPRLI